MWASWALDGQFTGLSGFNAIGTVTSPTTLECQQISPHPYCVHELLITALFDVERERFKGNRINKDIPTKPQISCRFFSPEPCRSCMQLFFPGV